MLNSVKNNKVILILTLIVISVNILNAQSITQLALKNIESHNYDTAIQMLKDNLMENDGTPREVKYYLLGQCYYEKANLEQAFHSAACKFFLEYYNNLLNEIKIGKRSDHLINEIIFLKSLTLIENGDWNEALSFLNSRVFIGEYYCLSEILKGACKFLSGRIPDADQIWKKILESCNNSRAKSVLGFIIARLNYESMLTNSIELCMNNNHAHSEYDKKKSEINMAWAYYSTGNLEKANSKIKHIKKKKIYFEKKIRQYEPSIFKLLSNIYHQKAIEYFEKAIEEFEDNERYINIINYFIAKSYFGLMDYQNAIRILQDTYQSLNSDEHFINALSLLGMCYYKINQPSKAEKFWGELMMKKKKNPLSMSQLGYYFGLVNDSNKNVQALELTRNGYKTLINTIAKDNDVNSEQVSFSLIEKYRIASRLKKEAIYPIFNNYGYILYLNGKLLESKACYEQIRNIEGWNSVAKNDPILFINMIFTYYELNRTTECNLIYYLLQENYPEAFDIYDIINLITIQKKKEN